MTKTPLPNWITEVKDGVVLRLHIQPKASRSGISGEHGEGDSMRLKIRVAAPPVDGAANEELLRFLKKATGAAASRIHLIRGDKSRSKDVLIEGASPKEIAKRLA